MILTLVLRSLRQHLLSTSLAVASLALAGGLLMTLFVVQREAESAFGGDRLGFDAVLGARGSSLQLVLNAVFHLETSPGNIPWELYETIRDNPAVSLAVPYALGDNYRGFRMVGTKRLLFEELEFTDGGRFTLQVGRLFDEKYREALVGSFAAQETGLKVGDIINPYHGLSYDPAARHDEEYLIVGILQPTNTPADRVIWIPIEGVFRMEGHVLRGSGEDYEPEAGVAIPTEHKEVSAVMVKLDSPQAGFALATTINRQGRVATFAYPIGGVMAELFQRVGWATLVLRIVAVLVAVVALLSNTAALLNTLNERRRDIAILRSLGASRGMILRQIVLEAGTIGALGAAGALCLYVVLATAVGQAIRAETGLVIDPMTWHPAIVAVPLATILLSAIAGLIPALGAYRTDVAKNLTPIA